mmetsp:Transcript_25420/g.73529  ORF Transcript_25420/g.73529 Transcript_25420/m.73529 type:complete len:326 (-) Transcript_25420:94-1071(-)
MNVQQLMPGKKLKKPKRPMTAYNFFFQEEHQRIREEEEKAGTSVEEGVDVSDAVSSPSKKRKISRVGFEDLGKLIGKRWKETGKDELERYRELARKDSERYKRESEKYYEDQISAVCMGYNKLTDEQPSLSTATVATVVTNPAFHAGTSQRSLSLAQEANLVVMKQAINSGRSVSPKKRGRKSKKDKAAEGRLAAVAASNNIAAGSGRSAPPAPATSSTGVNPFMLQMNGPSPSQLHVDLQQQWMHQQATMMTMMMANPALQLQFMQMTAGPALSSGAALGNGAATTSRSTGFSVVGGGMDTNNATGIPARKKDSTAPPPSPKEV